jgi:DNA uptake protein ComE-like DNA-binding protein
VLKFPNLWTARQRRVVLAIGLAMAAIVLWTAWQHPVVMSDPPALDAARPDELANQIDPNTADLATLAALPTLGEKRARAIVAFRENFATAHPDRLAFSSVDDLMMLKGFGIATVMTLKPMLCFPTTRASNERIEDRR